jgi:hypothetical protein
MITKYNIDQYVYVANMAKKKVLSIDICKISGIYIDRDGITYIVAGLDKKEWSDSVKEADISTTIDDLLITHDFTLPI